MLFSLLKSVQNLLVLSFLSATTIGKLWGDLDECVLFAFNILTALSTIGCLTKGFLYGLNLIGGWLVVSILILIVLILPKSVSFCEQINILFYELSIFLHLFSFTNGPSFSQLNNFINIANKKHKRTYLVYLFL